MDESEAIVELLEDLLGDHGLHYPNKGQISFNCPVCDEGRNKHNLEINYINNVYKCWSCGDVENTHGSLGKLFDKYGNRKLKKLYNVLKPCIAVLISLYASFALFKFSISSSENFGNADGLVCSFKPKKSRYNFLNLLIMHLYYNNFFYVIQIIQHQRIDSNDYQCFHKPMTFVVVLLLIALTLQKILYNLRAFFCFLF